MPTYDWKRYWCSREGEYRFTYEGFLDVKYGPSVKPFGEISATRTLILLGEPGIGKTFAMNRERDMIWADVTARKENILWPDLQVIADADDFRRLVTDTAAFQAWFQDTSPLHLYMDALDECMLRVPILGRLLTNAIKGGRTDKLWLRLTCRTAEWSNELETELKGILGSSEVAAFELLPLTKDDVATAVRANKIDVPDFFRYVEQTGSASLASRPIPLDFLIRCFVRGELPATQADLYERGCLTLCQETEHRVETGLSRQLAEAERLAVAKRIAAYTTFSRRSAILFGHDDLDIPADAIRLNELAGGQEKTGGTTVDVTERSLRDTLDTGLFTSRQAKTLGWAHHTYQEYLAAKFLIESDLATEQILALILHPDDPARKLTPQLHGVAAWLAALNPAIFRYVAEHEPELMLFSDAVMERAEDRALLVREIIRQERKGTLPRIDPLAKFKLRKLSHPDIADQLRPVLTSATEPGHLRELVADIAKHTDCYPLVPDLIRTALDTAAPIGVRVDAASAAARLGDEQQCAELKPLLEGPVRTREERWLVRLGLSATWPHALSADELFAHLDPKRRRLGYVADDYALIDRLKATLRAEHLLPAVKWVLRRVRRFPEGSTIRLRGALEDLEEQIVRLAWRSDDQAVTTVLAEVAAEKVLRWEPLVPKGDPEDESSDDGDLSDAARRRHFASSLLPALARKKEVPAWLIFQKTQYLVPEDLEWLARRQAEVAHTDEEWQLDFKILLFLTDFNDAQAFETLWKAGAHNPKLSEWLSQACAAVALDSNEANKQRGIYKEIQEEEAERTRPRRRRRRHARSFVSRKTEWLARVREQPCTFWQFLEEMTRKPDTDYVDSMALDVHTFPGWEQLDTFERERAVAMAERFVRECDPYADSWFGTKEFALAAMGGVRALLLLKADAPRIYESLDAALWRKWIPALLGIPNNDPTVPLLGDAYRNAPEEVISRLQQLVRAEDTYAVHRLTGVLDETIVRELIAVARAHDFKDETLISLLKPLLDFREARAFAEEWVLSRYDEGLLDRAAHVAALVLVCTPNESWPAVWPLVSRNAAFGRTMLEKAVENDYHDACPAWVLEEERVADLYLWLTREYPPEPNAEREGPYTPDTRDRISTWRSYSLNALSGRGTSAACDALRRIIGELPNQTYLPGILLEAEAARRMKTWQPTAISVLRQLLEDSSRRQVRSDSELADVIVESLRRLGARLQDETPAAVDLWNTDPVYKPRSENELSDYVARFLRDDLKGVVIGREVEIRRSTSPGGGERTDIHVDMPLEQGRARPFRVIVEAKGCWNSKIRQAMKDQLARRYLRDNATRTGIYLVGWFRAKHWDSSDTRRTACNDDPETLAATLKNEAIALQAEGFDIRVAVLDCSLR